MEEKVMDITENAEIVIIPTGEYRELVSKATALDILSASMQRMGKVDDGIVWAVTGANPDRQIKELQDEKDRYWEWYSRENKKVKDLEEKVSKLTDDLKSAQMLLSTYCDAISEDDETEEGGNG